MRLPNLAAGATYRDNPPPGFAGLAPAAGAGPQVHGCSGKACVPGVSNCGANCRCLCSTVNLIDPSTGMIDLSSFVGCTCQP